MLHIYNSDTAYGLVSKLLHWCIAILFIAMLALGLYLEEIDYLHPWHNAALYFHKAFGMMILLLGLCEILWVRLTRSPAPLISLTSLERLMANVMHRTLYLMLLLIPVTGYFVSTSAGDPIDVFGISVPAITKVSSHVKEVFEESHEILAYISIILVLIHITAALKHHFVDKDNTLRRML